MYRASVSNIDCFRIWKSTEELPLAWITERILGTEETPAMRLGKAFHSALERIAYGDVEEINFDGYSFVFDCDCAISVPKLREIAIGQVYGGLLVRGRLDAVDGLVITDYKSTERFDPDRFMESYQWRFYLDMMQANIFRWKIFVLQETEEPQLYMVDQFHELEQKRYPALHDDCLRLAGEYLAFAQEHLPSKQIEDQKAEKELVNF